MLKILNMVYNVYKRNASQIEIYSRIFLKPEHFYLFIMPNFPLTLASRLFSTHPTNDSLLCLANQLNKYLLNVAHGATKSVEIPRHLTTHFRNQIEHKTNINTDSVPRIALSISDHDRLNARKL